jgi:hypothetical protein
MVKIPSLDDLKKASTDFMDQARTTGLSGMVDKIKTGIDSATQKTSTPITPGDNAVKNQIQLLQATLAEVTQAQSVQAAAIRKIESQLSALSRSLDATMAAPVATHSTVTQNTTAHTTTAPVIKPEDKTNL